jgi:AraC-like DNA-binding protein
MAPAYRAPDLDVLSDVLGTLRLQGQVFCATQFSAPWGLLMPRSSLAHFHVVERGEAWLRLQRDQTAVSLASGELVILPHGSGHVLSDSRTTRPVRLDELLARQSGGERVRRHGGSGPETHLICGAFRFENAPDNPILSLLPPVIRIGARDDHAAEWLAPTLALLAGEARRGQEGSSVIVTRLTEVIFVQAMRVWIAQQPAGHGGWLGALRDPQIGTALALIHRSPEQDWSVATLARQVGMSRSTFAARFRSLVQAAPLAYLSRWRLNLAASLLRDDRMTVSAVTERVGYESEAAFSKAFKRHFGVPPRAYRGRPARVAPRDQPERWSRAASGGARMRAPA